MDFNCYIVNLEKKFSSVLNGFKLQEEQAKEDFNFYNKEQIKYLAYLAYGSEIYQVRMYGVFLFGYLSDDDEILNYMRDEVSKDENWRVQEILAKSFDEYCKRTGYEKALPIIDEWLRDSKSNTRRAVTEGLRIWTSRPYFKQNPDEAIKRLASLKTDESEYVRKSVGNALRDIGKKFPKLLQSECSDWDISDKRILQVYKLTKERGI